MLKSLAATAVVLGSSVLTMAPANALPGYATPRLEIKAGPGDGYPTVGFARYDTRLEINGCLRNWTWCDVTTQRARGWVKGHDIQAESRGRRIEYGAPWNVPRFEFNFNSYWNDHYRGEQFYRERDRWQRYDRDGQDGYQRDRPNSGRSDDRDQRWKQRYSQTYTYNDDAYYRDCRTKSDPAGVIAGSLIGGLLGNAAGGNRNRTAGTVAGVIVGGVAGAALTSRLECEDRSYAYKTYSQALNSGRANSNWQWENPRNKNYGDFRVNQYYTDPDDFRCATFTQQVYVGGRREIANGRACQQPDGAWAIVN